MSRNHGILGDFRSSGCLIPPPPTLYHAMLKPSPGYFSSPTEMSLVLYMRSAYMWVLRVPPIARAHHASELPQPSQVFHVLVGSTVEVMEVAEEGSPAKGATVNTASNSKNTMIARFIGSPS